MKHIEKNDPPANYTNWLKHFTQDKKRSPEYSDIPANYKELLKKQFIQEQKGLCCYCAGRIIYDNSHIEHFYPRHLCKTQNRKKQTEYMNMFASCNGFIESISDYENEFCGHRKHNWYDEDKLVSPIDKECGTYFVYSSYGEIKAAKGNEKARITIEKLGLNEYALVQARKKALEAIGYFDEDFDKEYALKIATKEDGDGYLPSFCNIIEYFAMG